MRVGFGNDHVAVELKNILMGHLKEKDMNALILEPSPRRKR